MSRSATTGNHDGPTVIGMYVLQFCAIQVISDFLNKIVVETIESNSFYEYSIAETISLAYDISLCYKACAASIPGGAHHQHCHDTNTLKILTDTWCSVRANGFVVIRCRRRLWERRLGFTQQHVPQVATERYNCSLCNGYAENMLRRVSIGPGVHPIPIYTRHCMFSACLAQAARIRF